MPANAGESLKSCKVIGRPRRRDTTPMKYWQSARQIRHGAAHSVVSRMPKSTMPISGPIYEGSKTGEADTVANRVGGVSMALRRLELDESRDIAKYAKQLKDLGDEPSINILTQVLE